MAAEKPPGFWVYTALLGLISLLLATVGTLSITRFDKVEVTITKMADSQSSLATEVSALRATIDAWAKQNFVPRDLFDQRRADSDRRMAALEAEIAEMRKGK